MTSKWAWFLILAAAVSAASADEGHKRGGGIVRTGGSGGGGATPATPATPAPGHHGGRATPATPATPPSHSRPSVITRMQRYRVPRPDVIHNPNHVIHDQRHIEWPKRDDHGARITQTPTRLPPAHHNAIVRDQAFMRHLHDHERAEVAPRRYYWHDVSGRRYAHYYDGGIHWYGFYNGPHFYWTRYYASRWWWYDAHFARWVFWWNGYWWWPGPLGVTYVYVDNSYYPYENGEVIVAHPDVIPPPAAAPAPNAGSVWYSPDGRRMVQIVGVQSDAFLYDRTGGDQPSYMKYLGPNVAKVRFSGGKEGKPLQILLDYKDGSFAVFDAEGNSPQSVPTSASELPGPPPAATPPPMPDSTPPAPDASAPESGAPPQSPPAAQ